MKTRILANSATTSGSTDSGLDQFRKNPENRPSNSVARSARSRGFGMEGIGSRKGRTVRRAVAVSAILLAAAGAIAAFAFIDFERYRSDADRVKRLAAADLAVSAAQAARADWPQWRGPNRDGA